MAKKSIELKAKQQKAIEKVEKITKTLARHHKQAEKKLAEIKKNGWDENDRFCRRDTSEHDECYWLVCEYDHKLDDIKGSNDKLKDAQRITENWNIKLDKQLKIENTYDMEMPEVFKQCQSELAERWTQYDLKMQAEMERMRKKLSYEKFRKAYVYTREDYLSKTKGEFIKANAKTAEAFIIDLHNRVKAVVGKVTDYSNVYYSGQALNGYIVGKDGKAEVETIVAGGYNIQRLHLRVLVKEMK